MSIRKSKTISMPEFRDHLAHLCELQQDLSPDISEISLSQGVPPPVDNQTVTLKTIKDTQNTIEVLSMKSLTQQLSDQLKSQIMEFKQSNELHNKKKKTIIKG